jgi:exonuclease III
MLSETRRQIIEKDLWSPFKLFFHPASHSGRAGEGLLLGIRYSKEYHILPYCTKQGSLWAKIQFKGGGLPLIIGTTYIPPSGSPLLSSLSLATRMKEIQKTLGKAKVEGYAFLGGDLNSRVGPLPPMAPGGDPNVNPHGRQLLRAVHKLGVYICTGRVMGDIPAGVSYHGTRRSAATRLDHIIVSPNLIPHLQDSCIDRERSESDHFPLCASLSIPIHPTPCPSSDQGGHPLSQISWCQFARDRYVQALEGDELNLMSQCEQAVDDEDIKSSIHCLYALIKDAAKKAGMHDQNKRYPHKGHRRQHQPFFDQECRALKREVWRYGMLTKWRGDEFRRLERKYHAIVRRKKRAYQAQKLKTLIHQKHFNPHRFWKTLRRDKDRLPEPLKDVSAWDSYINSLASGLGNEEPAQGLPIGAYPPRQVPEDHGHDHCDELNAPFTVEEIDLGLRALANGKSPGKDGYPTELFRYAQPLTHPGDPYSRNMLSHVIADIFTMALRQRTIPAESNVCLVTPVYKKGDAYDTGNYRPIAVGESLMRLYANVLNARLVSYLEKYRLRVDCQTGFRPEMSTTHQIFVIQHLIDWAMGITPLHFAFLDLSKAYDRVSRLKLSHILEQLGVQGDFLYATQAVIDSTVLAIKIDGKHGGLFESNSGIPQGCPISPTLFGIMSDGLPRYLAHHCPTAGLQLPDGTRLNIIRIQVLGFADDFVLVAPTVEDLQVLVNATQEWCKSMDMSLNGAKTQYLLVNPDPRTLSTSLEVAGVSISPVQEVKYLGLQIHAKNGLQASIKNLEQRFWIAWEDLTRAYSNLGCSMSMMLMTELYLACLPPLISYGCEVWAFRCFQGRQLSSGKPSSMTLLDAHKRVLAQILGVRRTVPEEIINCELNIFSLWSTWILRMVRFWNNIAAMRPDSLHYKVLMHDIRLAIVEGRETFSGTLMQQLKKLGYYIADHVRFDRALQIDISHVKDLLDRKSDMIWDDLDISPRSCASPRALFCRYQRWLARPPHVPRRKSALKLNLPNSTLRTFMRFRLGCHDLPIDKGRQQGIPRDQRICTRCSLELVGDEHHLLFTCPAVQHVRQQFMHLFQQRSRSVQSFMWQEDLQGVAKFVTRALESYLTLPGAVRP